MVCNDFSVFSRSWLRLVAIPALFTCAVPAHARGKQPAWPNQLRIEMQRLADVGWQVRMAAGTLCPAQSNGIGASFDYIAAYSPAMRAAVMGATGMGDLPQVAAVAKGSPADIAGLRPGDEIQTIDGRPVSAMIAGSAQPALFADELEMFLSQGVPGSRVALTVRRNGASLALDVQGRGICSTQILYKFESGVDAYADAGRNRVAVTSGMISFNDDDGALAMVVAHELGHIIRLDGKAGSIGERRRMEDRADMIGGALARCAGYDLDRAAEFYRHYNRSDWLRWFRDPSHRSMTNRAERVLLTPEGVACPLTAADLTTLVAAAEAKR